MSKLENADKNFKINTELPKDVEFVSCFDEPISVYGLCKGEADPFLRLPAEGIKWEELFQWVKYLSTHTSGGRIKFATDSPYVAICVELKECVNMMHMPPSGHSGVDVYICNRGCDCHEYVKTFMPKGTVKDEDRFYTGLCEFAAYDDYKEHEVLMNLPLYNGVSDIKIGIKKGCRLFGGIPYKIETPVYFYGSSITQGGCASRPGNTYMGYLSRALGFDFVNLGFSGSARGEQEIARYIADKKMSAFVLDYDANAPTAEHLASTHYDFYKTIRDKNKELPIILMSYPQYKKREGFLYFGRAEKSRDLIASNNIIVKTYLRAVEEGDKNICYIDGETLFGYEDQDFCTVDNCHPNDHGFYMMAKALLPVLKKILG